MLSSIIDANILFNIYCLPFLKIVATSKKLLEHVVFQNSQILQVENLSPVYKIAIIWE